MSVGFVVISSFQFRYHKFLFLSFLSSFFLFFLPCHHCEEFVSYTNFLWNQLWFAYFPLYQFSSVTQSCPTLCDLMNGSTPGLVSITNSRSLPKLMSIESGMPSNHLILCHPLLLLPSIFPNIRVFLNVSALRIRWPKYWSFSFNVSPSNEHPGLISFRMDLLDLLAVQETLKGLL